MPEEMKDSTEKLMTDIKKDFVVIQKQRVRFVYAYLAIALCLGIGVGIGFVIGQNGDFQSSEARSILLPTGTKTINFMSDGTETFSIKETGESGIATVIPKSKYWSGPIRTTRTPSSWISYSKTTHQNKGGPAKGITVKFTEKVIIAGEPLDGKVSVLADDTAEVRVNGEVISAMGQGPFKQCAATGISCRRVTTVTIPAKFLQTGENVFDIYVEQATDLTPFGLNYSGYVLDKPIYQAQCSDGVDNDSDGLIDYPSDTGCQSAAGGSEIGGSAQCSDGLDNDGDGRVDANDPGCSDKNDNSESDAENGTLRFSLSSETPVSHIVYDNITDYVAGFRAAASGGLATISEMTFTLAGYTTVANVILKDGATVLATKPAAATVTFTGLNLPIQNGTSRELAVYLQFGTVGQNAGTSGENVKVELFSAKQAQGTEYNPKIVANNVYVFAAIPVVSEAAIGGTPILGAMEIYKWTVTSYGGEVKIKQFGLKVGITDQAPGGTLTLGNFALYRDGAAYTSNVTIRDQAGNDLEADNTGFSEADTHAYITFGSMAQGEDAVNGSVTYSLLATPAGFGASEDDSFKAEMLVDRQAGSNPIMRNILDENFEPNKIIVGMGSNSGDKGGAGLPQFLIWSDNSAVPHSASVRDAAGSVLPPDNLTFSADWWNDYLVKSYPLGLKNFTF